MKLTKDDKAMLRKEYSKVWRKHDGGEDEKMVDHCVGSASGYIAFGDDIVVMDKPYIKTEFWFGEHTWDYQEVCDTCEAARRDERRFIVENLKDIDAERYIDAIDGGTREAWLCRKYPHFEDNKFAYVHFVDDTYNPLRGNQIRKLDKDELDRFRRFCEEESTKFEKRLATYLKRYGLSKCHFSVYWADR